MSKLTLTPINASYGGISKLNAHLAAIEDAIDNTLSRDGSSPNQMEADIDMNSNQLLNLQAPAYQNSAATKGYVDDLLAVALSLNTFLGNASGAGVVYVSPEGVAIGPKVVFVDLYDGIYPDGSADSTAGLKALITAQGTTNIEYVFSPEGNYKFYSTDAINTTNGYILNGVCTNFYLNFNGATITVDRTFANTLNTFAFNVADGSSNIRIGRHTFIQTNNRTWPAGFTNGGTWWLSFSDAVNGVYIEPINATGGLILVNFGRGSDATKRVKNVYIESLTARYVGYGIAMQNNGDNIYCRYMNAKEGGRAFIAYNWHDHFHIDLLVEQDQYTQGFYGNNSSGSNLYSNDATTGSAYLNHIGLPPTGLGSGIGEAVRISVEQRGTGAGTMGPLHIKSRSTLNLAGAGTQGVLVLAKTTTGGVADTTAGRGHKLSLVLDIECYEAPTTVVADLGTAYGDWAGEDLTLVIDKMLVRGGAGSIINIDYDGMATGPLIRYLDTQGTVVETGTQSATCAKVVWRTVAGNNGNLVTENRANAFSASQDFNSTVTVTHVGGNFGQYWESDAGTNFVGTVNDNTTFSLGVAPSGSIDTAKSLSVDYATGTWKIGTATIPKSSGATGGAGSGGAGNQYVALTIGGTTYKILHDGTI